jgi:pectinesterase
MNCELGDHILPEGWDNWRNPENEKTARYSEYKSYGSGSNISKRVAWSHQLTDDEAKAITIENVFTRDDKWNPTKNNEDK